MYSKFFHYYILLLFIVGWASWQNVQGFGEPPTVKSQMLNLIRSVRTVAKGVLYYFI